MTKANSKGRLRLAYSSSATDNTSNQHTSDIWQQLDLFAKPDAVFFVAPEVYPLQALIDFLKNSHVTQIIDLRQIPHFSFGGTSRARFLDVLAKLKIDYYSLASYSIASGELGVCGSDLIRRHLKTGPSLVFSDLEPDRDPDVATTTNNLREAGVQFILVYAPPKT